MPIYQRNGKTYNIPDYEVEGFEKTYPDATQKYVANGRNYNIPVSERSGFLFAHKDATPFDKAPSETSEVKSDPPVSVDSSHVQQMDSVRDFKPIIQEKPDTDFNLKEAMDGPTDSERREQERKRIEEQIAQQKLATDKGLKKAYQEHSKKEKEEDDQKGWFRKIVEGVSEAGRDVHRGFPLSPIHTDENIKNLHSASESVNQAEELVNEAKHKDETGIIAGVSGFGRGFWNKLSKLSTWDMGMLDMSKSTSILNAVHKYNENQPLTNEEETLLDAVALEAAANGEFSGDMGRGYKAGSTTAESLPFMAEFMVNPATGTGQSVGKAAAKRIISDFGKEAAKSTIGRIARNSARVAGDIAGAGIMTGTTGAMRTVADAVDRTIGEVKPVVDSDGYYRFEGTEGGDDPLEALVKAYGASTIENFSEMFGDYLAPIGSFIGSTVGKGMSKIGLGKVNKIIGDIKSSDIARAINDFQTKTKWNGMIGEYLEEQAGMAMNALTVGDNELSDMIDPDTQIDTFLGVSAFGGFFSSIKTAGYAREKHKAKKRLNEADHFAAGPDAVGAKDWVDLKGQIDQADDSELISILSGVMSDTNISDEGKQAALIYAGRLKAYHGASLADLKRKVEGDTPDELVQSQMNFDEGYKLAEADKEEKRKALKKLNSIESKLDDEFLSAADDGRYELLRQRAEAGENVSNELAYINAESRFNGMITGIRDAIDEKVATSNQYITNLTHQDGNVYDVTLTVDEKKHVFPINGRIVIDENGIVDRKKSDSRFIVRDDTGKIEMRSVDDLYRLESSDNADILKDVTAQSIREQESARYAEEIETPDEEEKAEEVASIQPGDVVSLDMQGIKATATVQSKSDGSTILQFDEPIEYDGKKSQIIELSDEQVQSIIIPNDVKSDVLAGEDVVNDEIVPDEQSNVLDDEGKQPTEEIDVVPIEETAIEGIPAQEQVVDPAATETESAEENQVVSIPVDKKGNKVYHKVPVEVSLGDMRTYGLDDAETDEFVNSQKVEAAKRVEKLQKGKPKVGTNLEKYQMDKKAWTDEMADAQAQNDYWNEMEAQIQATREQPGDVAAEEIKSMGEPLNGGELAAVMLGNGKLPLLYGDYKRETGFSNTDARGMFGMFASKENGGMTIEQAGEQLMLADLENGTNFFDQNDPNAGRNAIIEVLSSARTKGDLVNYINKGREAMAERERQAEYEAYERWCDESFHMLPEDYEAYEEQIIPSVGEHYKDFDADEFYSRFVEELNKEDNDTERKNRGTAESDAVLQEEKVIPAGRTGTGEDERGDVQAGLQGGIEDGTASENVSGRDVEEGETAFVAPEHVEGESLFEYAERVNDAHILHEEEQKVDTNPTEAQKEVGNYKKGHIKVDGFDITIENPKDSERSGVDAEGKSWSVKMNNTYGYIRGTEGVDGDHIDIFLGDTGDGVYVVDQVKDDGSFDEHKVMYGFGSVEEARDAYLANYSPGWQGLGSISEISKEEFKKWIDSSHRKTKPFVEYKIARNKKTWQITAKEYAYSVGSPKKEIEIDSGVSFHQLSQMSGRAKNARIKQRIEERNTANNKYRLAVKEWENKIWDAYLNGEFSANDIYDTEAFYVLAERINDLGVEMDSPFKISKRNSKEREAYLKRIDNALSENKFRVERKKDSENGNTSLHETKAESEEQGFIERAKANVTYMKAPNGKPTNLNEKQWRQVRTKAFKDWFGDWENEPENASKVLDENGEPLVVYHGTSTGGFTIFNTYGSNFGLFGQGSYFTNDREVAESYTDKGKGDKKQVYGVFLNIRHPLDMNSHNIAEGWKEALPDDISVEIGEDSTNESVYKSVLESFEYNEYPKNEAQEILYDLPVSLGYDGVTHIGGGRYNDKDGTRHRVWIAMEPGQIKSATDNNGEFSGGNGDIRFREDDSRYDEAVRAQNDFGARYNSSLGYKTETTKKNAEPEEVLFHPVYTSSNVANKIYRNSVTFMKFLNGYSTSGFGEADGKINMEKAAAFYRDFKTQANEYKQMLYDIRRESSLVARGFVDEIVNDVDYALNYYKRLAKGEDVWRTEKEPRYKESSPVQQLWDDIQSLEMIEDKDLIQDEAQKLADALHTPIRMVNSKELTGRKAKAKGWFDTETGEIVIVLDNARSVSDIKQTVFHEVVGHRGLRQLFGKQEYDGMMVKLYGQLPENVRKKVADSAVRIYEGDMAVAMDEYLAEQAEKDETPSWWNKAASAIRDCLRKMGIDVSLSGNDVKYLLWRSRKVLEDGNIIGQAEDVVMRNRLRIGEDEHSREENDYTRTVKAVDEFKRKYAGAGEVVVIRSKEGIRDQLGFAGISEEDIAELEEIVEDGETIACYNPKFDKIVVIDRSGSINRLNSYLWHENTHKALRNVFGDNLMATIEPVYQWLSSKYPENCDRVKNLYSDESDDVQKEECVVRYFEDMFSSKGAPVLKESIGGILDLERKSFFEKLYNEIVYGTRKEENNSTIGRDGMETPGGSMEVRNSENVGESAEERGERKFSDAGERGLSKAGNLRQKVDIFSQAEQIAKDDEINRRVIRFRVGEDTDEREEKDIAKREYEDALDKTKNRMYRWKEAYQDSMLALKKLQDAIVKESGEVLKYFEDAYMAENQMSSKSAFETEVYKDKFLRPMLDAIKAITDKKVNRDEVNAYVMAKHGLERNIMFAKRDAEQAANDEFDEKISDVNRLLDKGDISYDEWEEKLDGLNIQKKDFYEEQYMMNRMRDYSGLTQLTEEEENYEEAAKEIVDQFEEAHGELCDQLWEKINLATKNTLKKSYESGLMTRSTYDKVRNMFEYYVPLRGWDDKIASDVYEYMLSERSAFQAPVKAALGRESQADDPFANIGNMAESGILQGNRNLMKQKFLNMVLNHPTSLTTVKTMWYENADSSENPKWVQSIPDISVDATADEIGNAIEAHESRMNELRKNGMATKSINGIKLDYRASTREKNEHTVVVKSGGKEYVIYINGNPRAAQAINGLTNPDASDHKMMQLIGRLNRQLAANFTTRNPAFVLSNMSRDVIFSTSAIWVKEDWKYAKRFDKNIVKNIGAIAGLMARYKSGRLDIRNSRDRHFLEFLENGGETGYTALHNVNEYKKMMDRHVKKSNGTLGSVSSGAHAIVDAVSFMNRCAENVSRFTTYQTSREMGRGISESIKDAKEVTVNFNKKGAGGLGAGTFKSLFLFFNAAVQSLNNFKELHGRSKSKFYTSIGGFAAAGILMPMINNAIIGMLIGDGDDDMTDEERAEWIRKRDAYDNLPEWVRRSNFCIWTGGERFITIPLPIELRAFYGLGEMWYQMGKGNMNGIDGKVDVKKASVDMVNQLTELLPINPLGGNGDALSVIVPDAGKPLYQVFANRDFFGKPIYKKGDYNELMPAWTKAYSGTAKWMVNSAEFINEVSGGDKYRQGNVDLNPAAIEHLFEGYLGGMGKTANQLYKTISMIWDEDERMWRNVPVANRFVSGSDNKIEFRKVNEVYYQCMDELKETEQRLRGYENEAEMGIEEYAEKYDFLNDSKEYERYQVMKEYKSVIDDMRKAIKESDPEEKKEIEMEINLMKIEMIDELKDIR